MGWVRLRHFLSRALRLEQARGPIAAVGQARDRAPGLGQARGPGAAAK